MILIFSSIFYFLFAQLSIALANKLLIKLPNNSNIKYNEYIYNAASFIIGISISIIFISFLNIFIGLFLSIITYLIISLIILKFKPFNINKYFFKDYFILLFIIFLQIIIEINLSKFLHILILQYMGFQIMFRHFVFKHMDNIHLMSSLLNISLFFWHV